MKGAGIAPPTLILLLGEVTGHLPPWLLYFNSGNISVGVGRYSDWLRAGRLGDRIPVGARFYTPVQTGPGTQQASCAMGTGSFPGVKSGWGVKLTPHPF